MKNTLTGKFVFKSIAAGAFMLLMYFPLTLTAAIYSMPETQSWLWMGTLPILFVLGAVMLAKWPNTRRGLRLVAAAAIAASHTMLVTNGPSNYFSDNFYYVICGLIGLAAVLKGMQFAMHGWDTAVSGNDMIAGAILYFAAQPFKLLLLDKLVDYNAWLIGCGIASMIIYLFIINERLLNKETAESVKSSTIVLFKRQNRMLIILITAVIAFIAMFRQLQRAVEDGIKGLLAKIVQWLGRSNPEEVPPDEPPMEPGPMFPPFEKKDPALWMEILDLIFRIAAYSISFVIVLLAIYFIGKKLYEWIRKFVAKLLERGSASQSDDGQYVDEIENLMTLNKFRMGLKGKFRSMLKRNKEIQWGDLATNEERVRFIYTSVVADEMKQGYEAREYLTPRETSAELQKGSRSTAGLNSLIDTYEEVRYGERSASDRKVAELKSELLDNKR